MRADFEAPGDQAPQLVVVEGLLTVIDGNVKGSADSSAVQEFGHIQIAAIAVIPARRDDPCLFHILYVTSNAPCPISLEQMLGSAYESATVRAGVYEVDSRVSETGCGAVAMGPTAGETAAGTISERKRSLAGKNLSRSRKAGHSIR